MLQNVDEFYVFLCNGLIFEIFTWWLKCDIDYTSSLFASLRVITETFILNERNINWNIFPLCCCLRKQKVDIWRLLHESRQYLHNCTYVHFPLCWLTYLLVCQIEPVINLSSAPSDYQWTLVMSCPDEPINAIECENPTNEYVHWIVWVTVSIQISLLLHAFLRASITYSSYAFWKRMEGPVFLAYISFDIVLQTPFCLRYRTMTWMLLGAQISLSDVFILFQIGVDMMAS